MAILDWPSTLPVAAWDQPSLQPVQVTGPESLGGVMQITAALSWRWRLGVTLDLARPERTRALLGLLARLDGMIGTLRMPICAAGLTLRRSTAAVPWNGPAGEALFLDGAGWAQPARGHTFTLAGHPAGETQVIVPDPALGAAIEAGHHITIGDDLHIVTGVAVSGGATVLDVMPPLRRAHASGTRLYSHATGLFRLASGQAPQLTQHLGRFGSIQIALVEAWERAA